MYPETRKKIAKMLEEKVFPGASYAFIEGEAVWEYREGVAAAYPETEPLREGMLYDLASLTKVVVTTTILLQLYEEGEIDFDQPVQAILPAFSSPKVTLRHLLTHTADLKGYIKNRDALSAAELSAALLTLEPESQFGKKVTYTDAGLIIAGFIIEKLTGKSVAENFEERVKKPLGMDASTYHPAASADCIPTENHPQRGVIRGEVHDPKARILGDHCGSAGLFAPMKDVLRFSQMLLHEGEWEGVRILKKETVRMLLQDWGHVPGNARSLGWNLLGAGFGQALFHTGYTGTFLILDPAAKQGFLFLSNRVHPDDHRPEWILVRDELIDTYQKERTKA
ncbi:beta-lactamase [Trichococcus palustris]|uniref:Beta-lactamase n=1 Tax=Trichococcus palustris TaxID=140314 RepID=A0A143YJY0_9LACT|nr:serine hydrolase domain-containing protein [Trichococcus palustris]CZQ90452.1 beta-lactamase [Trichococcus palustris]SFL11694.1 CubicO group peptidase, beta-lactamase class C family [Trichococcus palustris]